MNSAANQIAGDICIADLIGHRQLNSLLILYGIKLLKSLLSFSSLHSGRIEWENFALPRQLSLHVIYTSLGSRLAAMLVRGHLVRAYGSGPGPHSRGPLSD